MPDGGLHRARQWGTWEPTAPLVVEIVSPGDETWDKLPCYAMHQVDEILIVDPQHRSVHWPALHQGEYRQVGRSELIGLGTAELQQRIDWPQTDSRYCNSTGCCPRNVRPGGARMSRSVPTTADIKPGTAWQTECMRTVVLGESREIGELIEQRRRTGADLYDEVWQGEYHVAPAPHGSHGLIDSQIAQILGPLTRQARLFASGRSTSATRSTTGCPTRGTAATASP